MRVYTISSGCKHEGGSIDAVFVSKELAIVDFNKRVKERYEQEIEHFQSMKQYRTEQLENPDVTKSDYLLELANQTEEEYWARWGTPKLEETIEGGLLLMYYTIVHDYIALKEWEAE